MYQLKSSHAPGVSFENLESRLVLSVAAPTGLDATLVEPHAVRVVWNDVAGETGYVVERRIDVTTEPWTIVGDTGADVTHFTQDGLSPGRTYLYHVRARDAEGRSEPSNVDSVTVPGDAAVPAAPHLEAALIAPRAIRLNWTNVANETGYRIERRVDGSSGDFQPIASVGADVTTFVDDGLVAGKTYIYRVRAFNEVGHSAYSNTAHATTPAEGTVPAAPTELTAELIDRRFVRLRWNDVAGEHGYKIERRLDGSGSGHWIQIGSTGENVTTFVDERVDHGRTYVYRVRAFNAAGNSPYSNTRAITVPGETGVPAAPRLEVGVVGPRAVRLHWTNVANETGYRIERRVDGSSEGFREIRTVGADVTAITDDGLEPGKTYLYRVRAFNAAGNSAYSNTGVAHLPLEGLPTAPHELRATAVSPTRVELRWRDSTGETGYRVERRLDGASAWVKIGNAPANATSFVDSTARPGQTYIYRVRAFNDIGNSPWSNTAVARTPGEGAVPDAPRELDAQLTAAGIHLRWNDVAGEHGYKIERRLDGSGSGDWVQIGTTGPNITTFLDEHVEPGRTYLYRVRAFNAAGNSGYSNVRAVTVGDVTRPDAPRDLRAAAVSPTRIDLRWIGIDGETGYRIERRLDGTETWAKVAFVGVDGTSFSDTTVQPGRTYFYRVRAGGPNDSSAWSNVASAKTPAGPVTGGVTIFSTLRIRQRLAEGI